MKRLLCLITALFFYSTAAMAQFSYTASDNTTTKNSSSSYIIRKLETPNSDGSKVSVNSDTDVKFGSPKYSEEVRGYRVRIFFDNKQTARSDAEAASIKYNKIYPNHETYVVYEPPYFKVTAGDFLTRTEAVAVWGRILNEFPTAFIVNEDIPFSDIIKSGDTTTAAVPEE